MSAAPAPAAAKAEDAPKKGGKKKLIIIVIAVLLAAGGGGGGYVFYAKSKAAAAEAAANADDDDAHAAPKKVAKKAHVDKGAPPVFLPLEPFVVNIADEETERYLQLGITLQIDDAKTGDQLRAYMPAIRNNILMLVAHKHAADLQTPEGKEKLARQIRRETLRPMGIDVDADDEDDEDDDAPKKKKKKKKKHVATDYPVLAVHFSSFIIQ
jgi:flagellar protein FliL